jgi:hypothetical protein
MEHEQNMELDFWAKLETADHVRLLHQLHGELSVMISSRESSRNNLVQKQAVFQVLKEAGFSIDTYMPQSDCVSWMPDAEPTMPLFLPENPEALIQSVKDDYRARLSVMLDRLANAHVIGGQEAGSVPYGWLMLAEILVESFEKALELFPDGAIKIVQIKEKFGSLRLYVKAEGPEDFRELVDRSTNWVTAASTGRCAVTGRKGQIVDNAWLLCLCSEAQFWRANYPATFNALVYP